MLRAMRCMLLIFALLLVTACGTVGRGDPGGIPVTFEVELDRAYVDAISEEVLVVGDGPGAEDGKEAGFGFGHGVWTSSTEVELRGGTRSGSGDAFIRELGWGSNRFTVPLLPGRDLALSVHVFGGRRGARTLPGYSVPVDAADAVHPIDLTARALGDDLPAQAAE